MRMVSMQRGFDLNFRTFVPLLLLCGRPNGSGIVDNEEDSLLKVLIVTLELPISGNSSQMS